MFLFLFLLLLLIQWLTLNTLCIAEGDLELVIFLSLSPKCWDHWQGPPCLLYAVLRTEPRASCTSGKRVTNDLHPPSSPENSFHLFAQTLLKGQRHARSYCRCHCWQSYVCGLIMGGDLWTFLKALLQVLPTGCVHSFRHEQALWRVVPRCPHSVR